MEVLVILCLFKCKHVISKHISHEHSLATPLIKLPPYKVTTNWTDTDYEVAPNVSMVHLPYKIGPSKGHYRGSMGTRVMTRLINKRTQSLVIPITNYHMASSK
jgi:hypothetical protein